MIPESRNSGYLYYGKPQPVKVKTIYMYMYMSGLLLGCGKKVKFRGIFRDKFEEKMANLAGILWEFLRPVLLKNNW